MPHIPYILFFDDSDIMDDQPSAKRQKPCSNNAAKHSNFDDGPQLASQNSMGDSHLPPAGKKNAKGAARDIKLNTTPSEDYPMCPMTRNPAGHAQEVCGSTLVQMTENPIKKPRLVIKYIELDQFKSYGEKVTMGPFHKNFSSIIGPNGSGKSNSIDALLFVFGKRASAIRLKKASELIHKSKGRENLKQCSVAVTMMEILDIPDPNNTFDPSITIVEGSEFIVKRTATINNSSFYELNGKKATRDEVTDLLMSKGIDLDHSRFLILQGEVEAISLMRPKRTGDSDEGFLEYMEDLIDWRKGRMVPEIDEFGAIVYPDTKTNAKKKDANKEPKLVPSLDDDGRLIQVTPDVKTALTEGVFNKFFK